MNINAGVIVASATPRKNSDQAPVVAAYSCKCHDNTPEKGVCGEVFRYGKPGDEVRGWVLPEEVSEVKHTGYP
jgi:hypothetical protein